MTDIAKAASRLGEIVAGQVPESTRQAMRVEADQITRTGQITMHIAAMHESIAKLLRVLYERDADGQPANYDRYTGQILIPVPWGDSGWAKWGTLRRWEADCLRRCFYNRLRKGYPLPFDFNNVTLRWHLRTDQYPTLAAALGWIADQGITEKEWRAVLENNDKRRAKRRAARAKSTP